MCIRSGHDDNTAWRAASQYTEPNPLLFDSQSLPTQSSVSENIVKSSTKTCIGGSALGFLGGYSHSYVGSLLYFVSVFLFPICALPSFVSSSLLNQKDLQLTMYSDDVLWETNFVDYGGSILDVKPITERLNRVKRTAYPQKHTLSRNLISFVCDQLPDTCTRAAFLRLHGVHRMCIHLPLLYILPHIADLSTPKEESFDPPVCRGTASGVKLRPTDALFHQYLWNPQKCRTSLEALNLRLENVLSPDFQRFMAVLSRSFCSSFDRPSNRTGDFDCSQCKHAYWSWVCSARFPIFYPLATLPTPAALLDAVSGAENEEDGQSKVSPTSAATTTTTNPGSKMPPIPSKSPPPLPRNSSARVRELPPEPPDSGQQHPSPLTYRLIKIPACQTWCTDVETLCPYLNPSDSTSNGGEPIILCDESHYYRQPMESNSQKYGCEHDCCFSNADLLYDSILDSAQSDSGHAESDPNRRASAAVAEEAVDGVCFSLTARCFHDHLSRNLVSGGSQSNYSGNNSLSSSSLLRLQDWPDYAAWLYQRHIMRTAGNSASTGSVWGACRGRSSVICLALTLCFFHNLHPLFVPVDG
ncbi:unnamed protein product [Schistocephalus solidus]|uniref:Uncharacterized protein n=1 Tax=Schistocephalus solidus TaxID=70667 RepID=A0A0X3P2B0_SCHSO|nr:unnamed protein product [Schistocephalus solidus]